MRIDESRLREILHKAELVNEALLYAFWSVACVVGAILAVFGAIWVIMAGFMTLFGVL